VSSRTKWLGAGAAIALAVAIALWREAARAPTAAHPAAGRDAPVVERAACDEPTALASAPVREELRGPTSESPDVATEPARAEAEREFRGTLRYFDPYGEHRPVAEGTFRISCYAEEGPPLAIRVEHGVWVHAIPGEEIDFVDCVADGRRAYLHGAANHISLPASGVLDLLVTPDIGCRLVVVDATNGGELDDLEIYRQNVHTRWGSRSPGPSDERVAEHAASPFEVDLRGDDQDTLYVRSPGYAWNLTCVRLAACGDRVVALEPGGDLRVVLRGFAAPDGAEVRLRHERATDDPYESQNVQHATKIALQHSLDFESIEAGAYEVSVELGDSTWRPARIAATRREVRAGERTTVELELPAPEPAQLVHATGTIRAEGWPKVTLLELYAANAPHIGGKYEYRTKPELGADQGLYTWSFDAVEAADYQIFVGGPSWYGDLTIAPVDGEPYEIVVPPPARAHVRIVDVERGPTAHVEKVYWLGYVGEWRAGGMFNEAQFDEASSRWNFVAPVGPVSIRIESVAHAHRQHPVTLHAGDNEIDLSIARACGVIAVFVCRGQVVSRDLGWDLALETADGKRVGFANPLDEQETELILKAPGPGRYRLAARGLGAYHLRVPVDVDVAPDSYVRTVIELERP
jgi:hypothetical protein